MSVAENVQVQPQKAEHTSWKAYAIRFMFGGVITAAVGIISQAFGPVVAGLFLAFPAILPASLTLIAQKSDKKQAGMDARGAALGSIGLIAFGATIWLLSAHSAGWATLLVASIAWFCVSILCWLVYCRMTDDR
jgi:low temperature requirement protein LtrA